MPYLSPQIAAFAIWFASVTGCVFVAGGCAKWSQLEHRDEKPSAVLPKIQMPDDSVPVELIFLRMGTDDLIQFEKAWPNLNEQSIPLQLRRRLDQNGIRAAVVGQIIPLELQRLIDGIETRVKDDPLDQAGISADINSHVKYFQCRAGQRKEIAVRPGRNGSMTLLYNHQGTAKGKTYDDPVMMYDLRIYPRSDGSSRMVLVPEIQHGPLKQKIVGQDFAFRRQMKRDADTWPDLAIDQVLLPGQVMLVTSSQDRKGLGEHFFHTETAESGYEQILMLIRMGQNRLDPAFQTEEMKKAIRAAELK